jgi:hypothetical protein
MFGIVGAEAPKGTHQASAGMHDRTPKALDNLARRNTPGKDHPTISSPIRVSPTLKGLK